MGSKNICIINCFETYEHRVDLLINYFEKRSFTVKVYASDFQHFEKIRRSNSKRCYEFIHVRAYKKNMSMSRLYSHYNFAKAVVRRMEEEEYDLIWVLVPPNSLVKRLSQYKRNHEKAKLIFDLMDLWPESVPVSTLKTSIPFKIWGELRTKYLKYADRIVTECDLYRDKLPDEIDMRTVYTLYLARDIKKYDLTCKLSKECIRLCYLGSINNIIDISVIVELVDKIRKKKTVELHIIGDGEKRDILVNAVKQTGAAVVYHGKIYESAAKIDIFNNCHYGLNIMKPDVYVGLTMKSMDYFEAGLPVINNIRGDTWEIIKNNHLGFNLEENTDIDAIVAYDLDMRNRVREFYEKTFGIGTFEEGIDRILGYGDKGNCEICK